MIRAIVESLLLGLGMMALTLLVVLAAMFALSYALRFRERIRSLRAPRACRSCSAIERLSKSGRCKACEWVQANWYELEFHFAKVVLEVRQIVWSRRPH